ncbi:MAG TPA: hypothetical protein VGI20_04795 [Rhizomicrobium sp.]|jgi:hypothetical protein
MNHSKRANHEQVLAIHPTTTGFGWTLFEGPLSPVDWGVVTVGKDRNARCLARIQELVHRLRPAEIVLEQFEGGTARRSNRVRRLYRSIIQLAQALGIEPRIFEREVIAQVFAGVRAKTRYEIATAIAARIDAFSHKLPPKRKIWLPDDKRMGLFNAAALAITFFALIDGEPFAS